VKPFDATSLDRLTAILAHRPADELDAGTLRRACVAIPLIPEDQGWCLLFSKRAETLTLHRGQVSFPGGGAHEGELLEEAALREMEEEVGVPRDAVRLIGRLDDLITRTGFIVAPFVGVLDAKPEYVLQASEVDEVYEVPVDALLDPSSVEVRHLRYQGGLYPSYFYTYRNVVIWGLTGRILKTFLDLVRLTV
jgi:8-oxo-dGTP pyrophosphatase MutT (NUDIX family)